MKRIRYLCFTVNSVHAVVSSCEINPKNKEQVEWLKRQCNGDVLLAIKMPKQAGA